MTQQTDELLQETDITLAELESSSNPILERVKERILKPVEAPRAGHSSHASSPAGKGHNSYVNGRFEDISTGGS